MVKIQPNHQDFQFQYKEVNIKFLSFKCLYIDLYHFPSINFYCIFNSNNFIILMDFIIINLYSFCKLVLFYLFINVINSILIFYNYKNKLLFLIIILNFNYRIWFFYIKHIKIMYQNYFDFLLHNLYSLQLYLETNNLEFSESIS
jgi:hypothetical protein